VTDGSVGGGIEWVAAVNVIVWTGLFLYLLRLRARVRALESGSAAPKPGAAREDKR
jgi:CcmD family protein